MVCGSYDLTIYNFSRWVKNGLQHWCKRTVPFFFNNNTVCFFLSWLFALLPFNNPAYLFPMNIVVINFLLLKLSDHWNYLPAEGLPD